MNYTLKQQEYIDSVGGNAHQSAVRIIGELDKPEETCKWQIWTDVDDCLVGSTECDIAWSDYNRLWKYCPYCGRKIEVQE